MLGLVNFSVGVIGAGQLARMLAQPAIGLGITMKLLAEGEGMSANPVYSDVRIGDYTDEQAVIDFAKTVDVLTFDHEHVPTSLLRQLQAMGDKVCPGPDALVYAQDKLAMRQRLTKTLDAPAPRWRHCEGADELRQFGDEIGWPIIAKASRGGYDGHGVWKISDPGHVNVPFDESLDVSAGEKVEIIGEELVDFSRELSAIVARTPSGQAVAYPISETIQKNGVCAQTITPAPGLSAEQAINITRLALDIADDLGVVGLLAVELMQRKDGSVVVNELAMRPHNTGHWTIDGAHTSQFENHLRAICDLPLGDPSARAKWTVMTNVLGGGDLTSGLLHLFSRDPQLRVQLYGKESRPGRKLGHVTCYGDDLEDVRARSEKAAEYLMTKTNLEE